MLGTLHALSGRATQILALTKALASLYGLHRLCLWLEKHGWLYYKNKSPGSSAASCFVALQQVLEPPVKHVYEMKQQKRTHAEEEAPGQNGPSQTRANSPEAGDDRKC